MVREPTAYRSAASATLKRKNAEEATADLALSFSARKRPLF